MEAPCLTLLAGAPAPPPPGATFVASVLQAGSPATPQTPGMDSQAATQRRAVEVSPQATVPKGIPGSTPASAIPVPLKVAIDAVLPDAVVFAARGGLEKFPGADKIPGLKQLIEKYGKIGYLAAVLVPVTAAGKDGLPHLSITPQNSTFFLSLSLPGRTFPLILTTKPKAGNFEVGTRLRNWTWPAGKDPKFIFFSNERYGGDLNPGEGTASTNGGVLYETPFVTDILKGAVRTVMHGFEADEFAIGLAGTLETEGGSDVVALEAVVAEEAVRKLLIDALLDNAKPYAGFAWRGSFNFAIHDGNLTLQAQKGPY
jgi:hypothetical protein